MQVLKNFSFISIQHGNSPLNCPKDARIDYFSFKPSIAQEIIDSDVIVTAGGSGTILECLEANKRVIAVINNTLQDNHQAELCLCLEQEGYLEIATTENLVQVLARDSTLKKWTPANGKDVLKQIINSMF